MSVYLGLRHTSLESATLLHAHEFDMNENFVVAMKNNLKTSENVGCRGVAEKIGRLEVSVWHYGRGWRGLAALWSRVESFGDGNNWRWKWLRAQ